MPVGKYGLSKKSMATQRPHSLFQSEYSVPASDNGYSDDESSPSSASITVKTVATIIVDKKETCNGKFTSN